MRGAHLLVVLDLVFGDDAVWLLRLLPGELDAPLLDPLLDDLADLRGSCRGKDTSISPGQTPLCLPAALGHARAQSAPRGAALPAAVATARGRSASLPLPYEYSRGDPEMFILHNRNFNYSANSGR